MKQFKNKNSKSEGFTLIETLVSLAIITIVCVLLSFCYSSSIRSLTKTRLNAKNTSELLNFDTNLRKTINNIYIPDWGKKYEVSFSKKSISFPDINNEEKSIEVKIPKNIQIDKIETLFYKNNKPAGIKIVYKIEKQEFECSCLFSSIPFGVYKL